MTIRKTKTFDCVAMKEAAQREIARSLDGLTPEQEIARLRQDIERGPLADWWRNLPKDPGPQPEAAPSSGPSNR